MLTTVFDKFSLLYPITYKDKRNIKNNHPFLKAISIFFKIRDKAINLILRTIKLLELMSYRSEYAFDEIDTYSPPPPPVRKCFFRFTLVHYVKTINQVGMI